jgi:hypothetical protein
VSSYGKQSKWCPPELTAAAVPLRQTGDLLRELADDSRGIEKLAATSPSADVEQALAQFVERWELVLWSVGGSARSLATTLRWAAEDYRRTEDFLARELYESGDFAGRNVRR